MEFPDLGEILPHARGMLLLRRVLTHDDAATTCAVDLADSALFRDAAGAVPAYVGIEYMAQCVAAHGGMIARRSGESVRPGLLLGTRRVSLHTPRFSPGAPLSVEARHVHGATRMLSFACRIWSAESEVLAEGQLNVYIPGDPGELLGALTE